MWRALCAALLIACAPATPAPAPTDAGFDTMPDCAQQPPPPSLPAVPGLRLPDEATVFSVHPVGPLTQAEGVVELTPVQVRSYYEQHPDLRVILAEDERLEAEILVTDGTYRMFVKAQIACATASNFTATVGSEAESAALPTPAGSPPAP